MNFFLVPRNGLRSALRIKVILQAALLCCVLSSYALASLAEEAPMRLSEWLSARTVNAEDYPLGLLWLVPDEKVTQAKIRSDLLKTITSSKGVNRLSAWLATLPVTGRVPISIVDADWLRANPKYNPVILSNHQVILPKRPHAVMLITSRGMRCQLPHASGGMLKDYGAACDSEAMRHVDWAWLVQPDGVVKRFGIASWNYQQQDEPAPGAWIWLPYREDKWAVDSAPQLAAFLATQGVSTNAAFNVEGKYFSNAADVPVPAVGNHPAFVAPVVTANDWGEAGLLQSPSARMQPAGQASMTFSRVNPYSNINVFLQPLDWMEFGFRYTDVSNRLYGPAIAGDQSYKDKSMDVKFALLEESAYLPQVAVGTRDMTGTGLFSGEYVVANKRAGAFDWSLGMGWGYLGARGNLRNPFSAISQSYSSRTVDVGQGGNFAFNSYFRGPAALFGGVQYQSPWEPLILKLEYDGNDYQHQPQANNQPQNSPWNIGAVYRAGNALNMTLGFERGNTLMLGLTLQTNLQKLAMPKLDDPAPIPVAEFRPGRSAIGDATGNELARQTGWSIAGIERQGHTLRVNIDNAETVYWREYLDRANAVLNRDAGEDINFFSYAYSQHGTAIVELVVDRSAWVRQQTQPLPLSAQSDAVSKQAIDSVPVAVETSRPLYRQQLSMFEAEPWLNLRYNLGGPDGFFLYQLAAEGRAKLRLRDDTWLQGGVALGLLDNYDTFKYTAPSNLPRVRTYVREYMTSSNVTMPNLQMIHTGKLTVNQYYSVYAGYLESMYAGVGGEWLYRSLDSPLAFGIDVNRVQQRDFNQDFGLREYKINTGHATLYWDTGWNDVLANVSAGRYLAGDTGVTVEMSRVFQNGVRFGGYFTKTNVSAEQFGEGSFDKGLYVIIPFDAMLTKSSSKIGHFVWHPLIRDGGAKLGREVQLYDMTRLLDSRALQYRSSDLENHIPIPSQRPSNWE